MNSVQTGTIKRDALGRWVKGQSGNPAGRPGNPATLALNEAIRLYRKKKKKDLIWHFVEQAFVDNQVLIALMKKLLPDKMAGDIKGEGLGDTKVVIIANGKNYGLLQQFNSTNSPEAISE